VDPQLEDAARSLGVGETGVFFRVSLPLAWRGILAGLLLSEAVQAGQDGTANFLVALTSLTSIAVLMAAGYLVPGRVGVRG
jgi:molybdate transport system permease protein